MKTCDKCRTEAKARRDATMVIGFPCERCDKSFGYASHLKSHIASVHDKLKPHQCEQCDKSFGEAGNLRRHISTVHDKLKPYRCEQCDKSFTQAGHLKTHMKICSGDPNNSKSGGELACMKALELLNIEYESEKTYPDLTGEGGRSLRYDFYLPESNKLIEFDGLQHAQPVRFGGISIDRATAAYELTLLHDTAKNEYATANSIELLRIPSTHIDQVMELIEAFVLL